MPASWDYCRVFGNSEGLTGHLGYAFEMSTEEVVGLTDFNAVYRALSNPDRTVACNPLDDGSFTNPTTLAQIAAHSDFGTNSVLHLLNIQLDGTLWCLPGGDVKLTAAAVPTTSVVIRNPTAAERANVCSHSTLAWTPNECLDAAVSASVDLRLQNIAS